jgi:hypothetical protein
MHACGVEAGQRRELRPAGGEQIIEAGAVSLAAASGGGGEKSVMDLVQNSRTQEKKEGEGIDHDSRGNISGNQVWSIGTRGQFLEDGSEVGSMLHS